ncbi:MAG TPA: hypothetical protein VKG80_04450 [Trebonia sp.]|nr:hypothetical protein [Trebonia sp.]
MHPQIASVLAKEHQRDLASQASRHRMAASLRGPRRHTPAWRVPRYRVNWSRTTLSPVGQAGRRERSWVIVISATRASFPHSG